jgi:large subunit ribosomal protein L9
MRVVLRDDVENLGRKGDIVDVRDGYARNFLVPRGLAIQATRGVVKQADAMRRNRESREQREREAAHALAAKFQGRALRIEARAGEGGKLFGSVGNADVVAALAEQFEVTVDRRMIGGLDDPWHDLGQYEVKVRLHPDVVPTLTVDVVAKD